MRTRRGASIRSGMRLLSVQFGLVGDKPPSRRAVTGRAARFLAAGRRDAMHVSPLSVRLSAETVSPRGRHDHRDQRRTKSSRGARTSLRCGTRCRMWTELQVHATAERGGDLRGVRGHGLRHRRRPAHGRLRKATRRARRSIASPTPPASAAASRSRASGNSARRSIRAAGWCSTRACPTRIGSHLRNGPLRAAGLGAALEPAQRAADHA